MIKTKAPLLLLLLYSAGSLADPLLEKPKHLGNKIELLFFQYAGAGQIIAKPESGCYQLILNQLNPRVVYISDAPARVSGSYSIPEFVKAWQHHESSAHVKPNAIFHAKNKNNQWVSETAVFSSLAFDSQKTTLTYTLCPLDKKEKLAEGQLESVNLFIDPFHPWPP